MGAYSGHYGYNSTGISEYLCLQVMISSMDYISWTPNVQQSKAEWQHAFCDLIVWLTKPANFNQPISILFS